MINSYPLSYSAHVHCPVDSQGKAWRFASQVQRWTLLASQPNALHKQV